MNTYHPNAAGSNESAMVLLTCGLVLLLCWLFFADFVRWSCWSLYWLWRLADFPHIHRYAAERINLLASTSNGADSVAFSEWRDVMNHTAGILFVPMLPLVVVTSWALARHPALGFRSRRAIDIHSLPRVMATFAPSVIPVLSGHRGDGLMNDTTPENAWAQKPEEFADVHGLIKRRVLDRAAATALFDAQTGPAMMPPDQWQPHERALLAIFGLQVFSGDRKAAIVAQARAEQLAARLGLPCPPLMTGEAVDGLQLELESLWLVYPRDVRPKRAKPQREMPFPDALYLPGEGEDEFTDGAVAR
ncbi:hypothetical protein [uncultured Pluralibacter sp.]|uniref:hypothetical protein n=1 Tax=uncultured Pluralibacter sp. TaxID=1490864 RepID=UPI002626F2DC|nr:hypothetical protein [uncultured Pluralibacter sp.]